MSLVDLPIAASAPRDNSPRAQGRLRRSLLPAAVALAVLAFHFVWSGLFPDHAAAQSQWVALATNDPAHWFGSYIASGNFWMGLTYATSLAFVTVTLRAFFETRSRSAGKLAAGGLTFSGLLPFVSCFLLGCCGSPMLGVYLGLFGAAFLPFAKPIAFGLTVLTVGYATLRMNRSSKKQAQCDCGDSSCQ